MLLLLSGLIIFWLTPLSAWWMLSGQRDHPANFWFVGTGLNAGVATVFVFGQPYPVAVTGMLTSLLSTGSLLCFLESIRRELSPTPWPWRWAAAWLLLEATLLLSLAWQGLFMPFGYLVHFFLLCLLEARLVQQVLLVQRQTRSRSLWLIVLFLLAFMVANFSRIAAYIDTQHFISLLDFSPMGNTLLVINYVSVVFYCYGYWGFVIEKNQRLLLQRSAELVSARERESFAIVGRFNQAGALSASIAHEINQPIAAIQLNTEEALRLNGQQANPSAIAHLLQRIARDNQRAAAIVQRIRRVFQPDQKPSDWVDPDAVLDRFLSQQQRLLAQHHIRANTQLEARVKVPFPEDELIHILTNLLSNAIDALQQVPQTQRELNLRTWCETERVCIEFHDTGCGIAPDKKNNLFNLFSTTKRNGMGLGLWLVRYIVERHDGRIKLLPAMGPGARFLVQLSRLSTANP